VARRVLIVDDDPAVRSSLADALADDGMIVTVAESGERALAQFAGADPDVVLTDIRMAGLDGLALLHVLRERAPTTDVILMTAYDDMPTVIAAMRGGAVEFLVKPLSLRQLRNVIGRVFEDRRSRSSAEGRAISSDARVGELIGHDPRMIDVFKLVGQAAATRATVLVRGESGTGKELVARAIHGSSDASAEPFVPVNCAALPNTLLESELFGHVRGAFTGAHEHRRGRFAVAGRGTVFLDEIGDTSIDFQTKLLRVIQDREFQPVGAERPERTEARVIAATHQDLEQMLADRRFREDLYYRLRVVEICIPSLRDRRDDIPLLARTMVQRASRALGAEPAVLSTDALDRLIQHAWPGNVRELENCIMRAVVIATGSVIRPEHIALTSQRQPQEAPLSSLDQVEREHLVRVLKATHGQKGRAAEILGVSRPRLNRMLQKHGLEQ
jgi:DNA-binding NtrC family response regulator